MKLSMTPGDTTLVLEKLPPHGGPGGRGFDSGCNPSGVTKVRVQCGCFCFINVEYRSTIKRICLDFQDSFEGTSPLEDVIYHGYCCHKDDNDKTFTFQFKPDDEIQKVVVWSDGTLANAVQFHTKLGIISPMYGEPYRHTDKGVEFQGSNKFSRLVGVHGSFGAVIDSLGFSFAVIERPSNKDIDDSWTTTSSSLEQSKADDSRLDLGLGV